MNPRKRLKGVKNKYLFKSFTKGILIDVFIYQKWYTGKIIKLDFINNKICCDFIFFKLVFDVNDFSGANNYPAFKKSIKSFEEFHDSGLKKCKLPKRTEVSTKGSQTFFVSRAKPCNK